MKIEISKTLITKIAEENIRTALIITGQKLVTKIRDSMVAGTGMIYTIKGETHFASSPGRPPAPWTGRLKDSITYHTNFGDRSATGPAARSEDAINKPQQAMGGYVVSVGSNVEYALDLEMGTKNISPRPYLWPMLKSSSEDIKVAFDRVKDKPWA